MARPNSNVIEGVPLSVKFTDTAEKTSSTYRFITKFAMTADTGAGTQR